MTKASRTLQIQNIHGGALYIQLAERHGYSVNPGSISSWPDTEANRRAARYLAQKNLIKILPNMVSLTKGTAPVKKETAPVPVLPPPVAPPISPVPMEVITTSVPAASNGGVPVAPVSIPVAPVVEIPSVAEVEKSNLGGKSGFSFGSVPVKPAGANDTWMNFGTAS